MARGECDSVVRQSETINRLSTNVIGLIGFAAQERQNERRYYSVNEIFHQTSPLLAKISLISHQTVSFSPFFFLFLYCGNQCSRSVCYYDEQGLRLHSWYRFSTKHVSFPGKSECQTESRGIWLDADGRENEIWSAWNWISIEMSKGYWVKFLSIS